MDPILIASLAVLGVETVMKLINAWQNSGEPTAEQMQQALIDKKPEDYFK